MKIGAERKKLAILGALLATAVVVYYINLGDTGESESAALPKMTPVTPVTRQAPAAAPPLATRDNRRPREFRPSVKRPGEQPLDPAKVDPTLRLDLLEKLQAVSLSGPGRNIFEFAAAPPPPPAAKKPEPKIIPKPIGLTPPPVEIAKPVDPPKPQAPPIPLKFYGFISTPRGADRRGFFLDGEDIVVAAEGDTIKNRYKVVRIGLNSVEMEDLQFQQRQTLRLEEQRG